MTHSYAKSTLAALVASVFLPAAALAQEACTAYSVSQGDTLGGIAQAAYGSFDYQAIFNANRNRISNPNAIEVGTVLLLPCADGSLPGGASPREVIAQQEATQAARATVSSSFEPPIRIVTGNGWEPFTSENLNGGGMFSRLATTSLNRAGNAREFSLNFVDDWNAHLDTLLPLGAMDVSIAWAIPDCSKVDMLSDRMARRCTELDASIPIYESVFGFFTLPGNAYESVRSLADLAGARICRPEGWLTFDLEEEGLVDPVIALSQPKGVETCIDMLMADEVDIVTLDVETVAAKAAEVGIEDKIVQNPNVSSLLAMRFVTHKTNPRGRVYLAMLNRGISEMRESGEWYAIVADTLAEHNNLTN